VDCKKLYRSDSLRRVAKEISKYKLDLVGVQEDRWDGGGTEPHFSVERGNENYD
jgi:hypothetical protein